MVPVVDAMYIRVDLPSRTVTVVPLYIPVWYRTGTSTILAIFYQYVYCCLWELSSSPRDTCFRGFSPQTSKVQDNTFSSVVYRVLV